MHKHATVSAWQRDHDGSYRTAMHGWELRVCWRSASPGKQRGFRWEAKRGMELTVSAAEIHEEIEDAMLAAEEFAATAQLAVPAAAL